MIERVDYNNISSIYNTRYKMNPLKGFHSFLQEFYNNKLPKRILEVGCGTGHWLNCFSNSECHSFGVDYSKGMLKQTKNLDGDINFINADANSLPLKITHLILYMLSMQFIIL